MGSKKTLKAITLMKENDQLATRKQIADIIREEMIEQLEGSGFWSEIKEIIAQGKGASKEGPLGMVKHKKRQQGRKRPLSSSMNVIQIEHQAERPAAERASPIIRKTRTNEKMKARGQLIRKIMAERGVNLAEASKIIKNEGLL